jgi:small subunit ribosomal protein S20
MAHHKSAIKRIRTSEKQRITNKQHRSKLHTLTKSVREADSKENAEAGLNRVTTFIDKMAAKGLIHRNKAANRKSRLARFVNQHSK